jgi:hypothetical protein
MRQHRTRISSTICTRKHNTSASQSFPKNKKVFKVGSYLLENTPPPRDGNLGRGGEADVVWFGGDIGKKGREKQGESEIEREEER